MAVVVTSPRRSQFLVVAHKPATAIRPACVECGRTAGWKAVEHYHGLCRSCYAVKAIRRKHGIQAWYVDDYAPGKAPTQPTEARPGTEEKIAAMTARASRREVLFHPLDGPQGEREAAANDAGAAWLAACERVDSECDDEE